MLVLALLVCACVFAAMTGPAVSLRTRSQALRQTLAATSPIIKTVQVDAPWDEFTSYINTSNPGYQGFGQSANLTPTQLAETQREIGQGLARLPVPLAAGAWTGLVTHLLTVSAGAGPRTFTGTPPQLELVYRNALSAHATLVAGSYAHGALPSGALAGAVTTQMASRFGFHPGSRVVVAIPTGPVKVVITAIVRMRGPNSAFWTKDSTVGIPSLMHAGDIEYWVGGVFTDPDQLVAMQEVLGSSAIDMQWLYPLAVGGVGADGAQALLDNLNRATTVPTGLTGVFAPAVSTTAVATPLAPVLSAFLDTQAAVQTVLLLLFVSLIVVGAAVILLAASMIAGRRADDLGLLRSRGASVRQVATLMLRSTAIVCGLAALAGAGLAVAVAGPSDASSALGLSLAAVTVVTALAGPPLIAAWQHRRPGSRPAAPRADPGREGSTMSRMAGLRRLVAEVTAVAASVAGLVVLHDQGVSANGGINLYLAVTPVLVTIPVVLIVLRLYPLAVGGLLRLSSRRAGATGFVALAGAARSSLAGVLPAFALVLALSLATFAGMVNQAITRGEIAASWQSTGADVAITATSAPITPAAEKAIAAVPGVRHLTATWNTPWATPGGQPVTLVAVDPASYAALVASTPFPAIPLAKLGTGYSSAVSSTETVPVLASPAAAASLGGTTAQLSPPVAIGPIRVRVAGTVTSIPGQAPGSAFLVMPIRRLPGPRGVPAVNQILITGSGISTAAMSAVIARQLPGASTAFRSVALATLAGSPLQHGADLILPLTIATAAGFGLFILMLGVALGTSDRALTLARLTVMGHERPTRLVLIETLPAVVLAVAAAVACALALPPLVGSALDLSVFTGSGAPVPVRPNWISLGLPAVAAVLLAAAALATEARRLSRRGVATVLRTE
jgi:putative ABC transport system permease protein